MDSPHTPLLRRSTSVFVFAGYLALAAVPQVGPAILLIPILALSFWRTGERLDANHPIYGVLSRAITIAYFCFLPLSLVELDLLPTVVMLVIYIQCYTLVHVKQVRNYYHLFLMSLFLLLAACVLTPDPIIGLILLIFLVSAVWANMALRIVMEELACGKGSDVELVSLDYMLHHAYRDQPQDKGSSMPAVAASLSVAVIVFTTLWFFLTPRIEAGVLGRNQVDNQTVGVGDTVDLESGGLISDDQTPVMLVQFPDEPDGQIQNIDWLYWRVTTQNTYGDNRWDNMPVRLLEPGVKNLSQGQRNENGEVRRLERFMRPNATVVHQVVYMDDVPRNGVPVLDLVQRVRVDDKAKGIEVVWGRDNDFTVRLRKEGSRRLNYEAWSEVGEPDMEELRKIPLDFSEMDPTDLEVLTLSPLSEESIELARNLMQDRPTLYDKVLSIQNFLSGPDFLYSLDDSATQGRSVIDEFVLRDRKGHCEKFATAMALLVRSQGIPARVVLGYRGGEWNDSDRTYTIRANMAHLWVEVWFPTAGWIKFDPSPRSDDAPGSGLSRLTMLASRGLLKAKMFWFREVVGFDRAAQVERLQNFSIGVIQGFRGKTETADGEQVTGTMGMLGFVTPLIVLTGLLVGLVLAIVRVRWVPLPRNLPLNAQQLRVVRLYLLLRRHLQRFGVVCAGKTAEELCAELHGPRWGAPAEALRTIELYNQVRFGNLTPDALDLSALRRSVLAIRPVED
ncbi:MAG: DUF3488 domain-containing protein [Candidatus Hydrogenedentes bacterium]|nr:DUF3488 domain-containing protein [Candidatus Hydrogenedentota bacterium]